MGVFAKIKGWIEKNKYIIATIVFFTYILFIDNNNFFRWIGTHKILHDQREQIEYYRREISATENKLNQLKSKKDSLEAFAREEYYYSNDEEDIYVVKHQE